MTQKEKKTSTIRFRLQQETKEKILKLIAEDFQTPSEFFRAFLEFYGREKLLEEYSGEKSPLILKIKLQRDKIKI